MELTRRLGLARLLLLLPLLVEGRVGVLDIEEGLDHHVCG